MKEVRLRLRRFSYGDYRARSAQSLQREPPCTGWTILPARKLPHQALKGAILLSESKHDLT